ncbi:hypothetical protein CSC67_07925 [Pusillimonas caeni]|uniref:type IV pilus biogenesis protein PilM n=1 Tax=Pusillimonas caeni TaxID=1348472 RepID=UPI000E5A0287|nr:hypothetical protein CSC67_07925 [Pusillimonas caeni]
MPLMLLVLTFSVLLVEPAFDTSRQIRHDITVSSARAMGSDMLAVRNALAAYLKATPGASGQIALASLGLPSWLKPDRRIRALAQSGRGYVYFVPDQPLADLSTLLGRGVPALAGIARNGRLVSPGSTSTMTLPASIPDQAVVLIV